MGIGFGLFAVGDSVMLAALPRFGRSYGPPRLPWLALAVLRLMIVLLGSWLPWVPWAWSLFISILAQLGVSLAATYACWVEPMRLDVTEITLHSSKFNGCSPLRLLQISDLHIERMTARENRLLNLVQELAPDVIVITGDYVNISYTHDTIAHRQTRELLAQLRARGGVYAITGSPSVDPPDVLARLVDGLDLIWLRDTITTLEWQGCLIQIAGVECSYDLEADNDKLGRLLGGRAADVFTLLLYHTPDVMSTAVEAGVDLYLAGHTHGGQLRLPGYGALVTASVHGKRYEMGAYQDANTLLYVSRGVGMEGKGAPRARFLCPPEIVLFSIIGSAGAFHN
jgi:predicted MPP superfamily phosphohydrolase